MQIQAPLQSLLQKSTAILIARGSDDISNIRALQMLLYGLGYSKLLNWASYRADGDYGGGTTRALAAYKNTNGLGNDGSKVDAKTLEKLLASYALLPTLRGINKSQSKLDIDQLFGGPKAVEAVRMLSEASGQQFANTMPSLDEAKSAFNKLKPKYGAGFLKSLYEGDLGSQPKVVSQTKRYVVSDDWVSVKLNKHKKGVWTMGQDIPKDFIENNESMLLDSGLTKSDVRVITPVSANEGNLNAINTWDNSFMTFGMFQWTFGQGGGKGELPALLKRLKDDEPEAFQTYFGQYDIDLINTNKTSGYLTLKGEKVNTIAEKEKFRKGPDWAFRFWRSGIDPRVKRVQVGHALDRINSFMHNDNYRPLNKFYIGDLVTSEYGVCLLLDHHVNRPGHLMSYSIGKKDIVGQAMKKAGLQDSNPSNWGTAEEQKLIKAYLPLRYASSMTHGKERALKIKAYLDKGLLSDQRFSYEAAPQVAATRSLDAPHPYTVIDHKEYENRETRE